MTTYNTYHSYKEAKISNPENDIYTIDDVFFAVNLRNSARCKPEEECMTVERFLNEGLIFTEGDLILDCGTVFCVTKTPPLIGNCFTVESSNTIDICDNERYVLRAAALEEKKPRTKVEYVKWNFECAWHAIKAFEDGENLYTKRSHKDYILIDNAPDVLRFLYDLHERIETPLTEREAFVEEARKHGTLQEMFDSGKFKLVNQDSDLLRSRIRAVAEWEMNTSNNHDWESVAESIYCAVDDLLKS